MLVNHHCLLQQQRRPKQQQQPHSPYISSRQGTTPSTVQDEDKQNNDLKELEMIGSRNYTSKRAPDSFTLYCAKRRHDEHCNGERITTQQLAEEWENLTKDQKAEFQNQSQCIQFTLDIDNHTTTATDPRKKHSFIPKILVPPPPPSMVIPNDSSPVSRDRDDEDESQDPYFMQNTSTYHQSHQSHQSHQQYSQNGHHHQQSTHPHHSSSLLLESFQLNNNNKNSRCSSSSSSSNSSSNSSIISHYHHRTTSSPPLSSHLGHHYYQQEQQQHRSSYHYHHLMNDTSPIASPPTPYRFHQQRQFYPPSNNISSSGQTNTVTTPTHYGSTTATASTKLIPNLSYTAAAEAAALGSLSFDEEKLHAQEQQIQPRPLTGIEAIEPLTPSTANSMPVASQSTKRKYGISPEKVKRPPNAYLLFNRDMRRQLHDVNQGLSSGEISKSISQRWKQLSSIEKDVYLKEEARLKEQHRIGHDNFIYTRRSKAEMKQAGRMKKQQQRPSSPQSPNAQAPMKKADDTLPKHPMSAYLHFAKEMRPIVKQRFPDARLVEISKVIGNEWRAMTQIELQKWMDMANLDKARYAQEMKAHILLGQHREHAIASDDAESLHSASIESTAMSPLSAAAAAATRKKRRFSSISSSSTHHSASNAAAASTMDELDSDIIACVAQMVNSSALSTQSDNVRGGGAAKGSFVN
ncbi:hypothetical protein BD408DRAFT_395944 [Parasitella parasitica]|nr:hypothetical protein BD408DRAFT_395944 [Parasitella parasitica]